MSEPSASEPSMSASSATRIARSSRSMAVGPRPRLRSATVESGTAPPPLTGTLRVSICERSLRRRSGNCTRIGT